MADSGNPNAETGSILDWFKQAERLFPEETVAEIRQAATRQLEIDRERMLADMERLQRQLDELKGNPADIDSVGHGKAQDTEPSATTSAAVVAAPSPNEPSSDWSAHRLVMWFCERNPGARSEAFVAFAKAVRPSLDEKNIYAALYKNTRPGKRMFKRGKRGHLRYYLREAPVDPE